MATTAWLAAAASLALLAAATAGVQAATATATMPGDPARGRAVVASRSVGLCLLCHPVPIPEQRLQGNLAPDLAGVGARLGPDELRQRLLDPRAFNPDTIMPAYGRSDGFNRPAPGVAGRPVLTPQQVEDVVAWLATLR
ncbi:MAG: sulfur oxidation c-type cytochrome SoxX [Aquabacterium sp.]